MLDSLPIALIVGTILGFLSGLGIGGGSLLIIWLTEILHMDQNTARGVNLLFFIPSAIVACFIRFRRGTIDWKIPIPAMVSGCIAAALCSWLSGRIEVALLKKLFGALLLAAGIKEIVYRERKAK